MFLKAMQQDRTEPHERLQSGDGEPLVEKIASTVIVALAIFFVSLFFGLSVLDFVLL